jgi:hypothetical protein
LCGVNALCGFFCADVLRLCVVLCCFQAPTPVNASPLEKPSGAAASTSLTTVGSGGGGAADTALMPTGAAAVKREPLRKHVPELMSAVVLEDAPECSHMRKMAKILSPGTCALPACILPLHLSATCCAHRCSACVVGVLGLSAAFMASFL